MTFKQKCFSWILSTENTYLQWYIYSIVWQIQNYIFLHNISCIKKKTLSVQSDFRITIPSKKSCNNFVSWYFSIIYCTADLVNENYLAASPKLIPELQVFILHGFKSRQIFTMLLMSSLKWTTHVLIIGNLRSSKILQFPDTA